MDGFEGKRKKLLSTVRITSSGFRGEELKALWTLITYYGGQYEKDLTTECTHLVKNDCNSSKKYQIARERGVKIVCCDWITDCINKKTTVDEKPYDPKYVDPDAGKNVQQPKSSMDTPTSKSSKPSTPRATTKAQTATPRPQSQSSMLQVQLNQTPTGPRGRGSPIRQNAQQQVIF